MHKRWTGKQYETDTYRYVSAVPLRDADDALMVNWCELTSIRTADGKLLYRNAFATSLTVDDTNVAEVVASGRARWKIENENNNTLKTKGYRFEHNYGHGEQYLSSLLATLIACLLVTYVIRFNGRQVLSTSSNTAIAQTFVRRYEGTYDVPVL